MPKRKPGSATRCGLATCSARICRSVWTTRREKNTPFQKVAQILQEKTKKPRQRYCQKVWFLHSTLPACNHDILWAWQSDFQFNMKRSVDKLVASFLYRRTRVPSVPRVPRTLEIINMQNQQNLTRQIFTPTKSMQAGPSPSSFAWTDQPKDTHMDEERPAQSSWPAGYRRWRNPELLSWCFPKLPHCPKDNYPKIHANAPNKLASHTKGNLFWTFHINESIDDCCPKATVPELLILSNLPSSQTVLSARPQYMRPMILDHPWIVPTINTSHQSRKNSAGYDKDYGGQSNFEAAVGMLPCVMANSVAFLQRSKSSEPKLQQHLTGLSPTERSQERICPTVIQLVSPSQGTDLEQPEKHELSLSLYHKMEIHILHHAIVE